VDALASPEVRTRDADRGIDLDDPQGRPHRNGGVRAECSGTGQNQYCDKVGALHGLKRFLSFSTSKPTTL
jgi:hypothetical protein